jgi:methionine biosynthesis protein MetW
MNQIIQNNIGYQNVFEIIPQGARVLDLGCGDGSLLKLLKDEKDIHPFAVELSESGVSKCIEKGLFCYQADIDDGLSDYKDESFDYVILNQTLQSVKKPSFVIDEILRIGKTVIVSFPNFAYYPVRIKFSLSGTMPKSPSIPYEWYDSPNIHMLTIKDFRNFCKGRGYCILYEKHFSRLHGKDCKRRIFPNLAAEYGFFVVKSSDKS